MNQISSDDLWKLFTDDLPHLHVDLNNKGEGDSLMSYSLPIKWKEWESIMNIVNSVLLSPPYIGYLLWLLWIRKSKFFAEHQQTGMSRKEMNAFFHSILTLHNIDTDSIDFWTTVVEPLSEKGYLLFTKEDRWAPGMRSGSGWTDVFDVAIKAKNVITKKCSDTKIVPPIPAIELDIVHYPRQIQAAHGVGIPVLEAYEASIDDSDGTPANVNVKNVGELKQAVYHATLRANIDSQNPDEKYRHYAMYKSGMTCAQIAKSENPDWESEYGSEEAKRLSASEANRIQKQVKRFEEAIEKT